MLNWHEVFHLLALETPCARREKRFALMFATTILFNPLVKQFFFNPLVKHIKVMKTNVNSGGA